MTFFSGYVIWVISIFLMLGYIYKKFGIKIILLYSLFVLLAVIITDTSSSYLLKNIFSRLRPCKDLDIKNLVYNFGQKCGGKYGFISSHASNSFAIFTFFIKFTSKRFLPLLIIPIVISYSRIYLGSHYPLDVICGAIWGILWAQTFFFFFKNLRGNPINLP
jgi:undecaprenyl-diphosphatase